MVAYATRAEASWNASYIREALHADPTRTRFHPVPVTTIARTLHDLAATSDPALVEQAVAEAIARGTLRRR